MFGPKRTYTRELYIDKESLILRFKNSKKLLFSDNGFWGGTFKQSQRDELFIFQYDTDIFHLSENAGFGGILEVIGKVKIDEIDKDKSLLKIKLQMGMFPVNLPQIEIIILLILGLILLPLTSAFLLLFSMICFLISIKWLINYVKVRCFLRNFSTAIGIENNWKQL